MPIQTTFMAACRTFFGLLPGQSSMDFGREVKALTPEDRAEITEGLKAEGFEIIVATPGA
jgi:hypothetical protein